MTKKGSRPPIELIKKFFQLMLTKQFKQAEQLLNDIRRRIRDADWNHGYLHALEGMMYVRRTNYDRYAFLLNLDISDVNELKKNYARFVKHSKCRLHAIFDRGFFSAWADFIKYLLENSKLNSKRLTASNNKSIK